jgi:hypothetical protein
VSGRWINENNQIAFEVKVYDFNQLDIRWAQAKGSERQVRKPVTLPRNKPFEIEVKTALPYTVQRKLLNLPEADYGIMCSADNILVIDVSGERCLRESVLILWHFRRRRETVESSNSNKRQPSKFNVSTLMFESCQEVTYIRVCFSCS